MRVAVAGSILAVSALLATPAVGAAEKQAKDPGQKLICKVDRDVGSNISERVCKTRAEWDEMRGNAQELVDRTTGNATGNNPFDPGKGENTGVVSWPQ